jgi:hypothetical protein
MSPNKSYRSKSVDRIFVLWGEKFDELAAAIFTCELRNMGLPVKIIGLTGQCSTGARGVVLCSDMSLSEALSLAPNAVGVVAPCNPTILKRMENDPRLLDFLRQADENQAQFVAQQRNGHLPGLFQHLAIATERITLYSAEDDLLAMGRILGRSLLGLSLEQTIRPTLRLSTSAWHTKPV